MAAAVVTGYYAAVQLVLCFNLLRTLAVQA